MFVCAIDIGRFSLKMVLTIKDPMPLFLEGQCFKIPVETVRVLNQLRIWADFYREAPKLVSSTQDAWPAHLTEALQNAGYHIKWVEHNDLQQLVKIWKSLCPDRRWLRAGLISYLYDSTDRHSLSKNISRLTVLEWMYASMRSQIMELEGELFAEGRPLCPWHITLKCPLCDTGYEVSERE